jgi:hypothetical protein
VAKVLFGWRGTPFKRSHISLGFKRTSRVLFLFVRPPSARAGPSYAVMTRRPVIPSATRKPLESPSRRVDRYIESIFKVVMRAMKDGRRYRRSCSMVHCFGDLSGRNLINLVPWRKRSSVTWSNPTSTTSSGKRGFQSADRSVDHRLGAPGALPVKPGA